MDLLLLPAQMRVKMETLEYAYLNLGFNFPAGNFECPGSEKKLKICFFTLGV